MTKEKSLDPRVNRVELFDNIDPLQELDQFQTYEVFHQERRGQQHIHVGIVHAPNADMALMYAKEQYARRGKTVNLWVVATKHVHATEYLDADIFDTTPEKIHRDPATYKVMDKINEYKQRVKG